MWGSLKQMDWKQGVQSQREELEQDLSKPAAKRLISAPSGCHRARYMWMEWEQGSWWAPLSVLVLELAHCAPHRERVSQMWMEPELG
jgi:hypothetical protein